MGATAHARLRIARAEAPALEGLAAITRGLLPLLSHEANKGRYTFRWRDRAPRVLLTTYHGGHILATAVVAAQGKDTPSLAGVAHALNTYASDRV